LALSLDQFLVASGSQLLHFQYKQGDLKCLSYRRTRASIRSLSLANNQVIIGDLQGVSVVEIGKKIRVIACCDLPDVLYAGKLNKDDFICLTYGGLIKRLIRAPFLEVADLQEA